MHTCAREYFRKKRYTSAAADRFIYDLAILVNREEKEPPSDTRAIAHFIKAGEELGFSVEVIGRDDYDRVGEFEASPGAGIAIQIDVEDAVGISHQMKQIEEEVEDLL